MLSKQWVVKLIKTWTNSKIIRYLGYYLAEFECSWKLIHDLAKMIQNISCSKKKTVFSNIKQPKNTFEYIQINTKTDNSCTLRAKNTTKKSQRAFPTHIFIFLNIFTRKTFSWRHNAIAPHTYVVRPLHCGLEKTQYRMSSKGGKCALWIYSIKLVQPGLPGLSTC